MRPVRRAALLVTLVALGALGGCRDDGADSLPHPTPELAGPTCVAVGSDGITRHLEVPAGFADNSEDSILDAYWTRSPADGTGNPDVVALDAYDRGGPDHRVVQRAMAAGPTPPDSGTPAYDEAVDRVGAERLTEATWTAPDRGGEGEHTGFVTLEAADGVRFTVTIVAASDTFSSLKEAVLATVAPGGCDP